MANLGEVLPCKREESNLQDPFVVWCMTAEILWAMCLEVFGSLCFIYATRQNNNLPSDQKQAVAIRGIFHKEVLRFPVYSPFLVKRGKY